MLHPGHLSPHADRRGDACGVCAEHFSHSRRHGGPRAVQGRRRAQQQDVRSAQPFDGGVRGGDVEGRVRGGPDQAVRPRLDPGRRVPAHLERGRRVGVHRHHGLGRGDQPEAPLQPQVHDGHGPGGVRRLGGGGAQVRGAQRGLVQLRRRTEHERGPSRGLGAAAAAAQLEAAQHQVGGRDRGVHGAGVQSHAQQPVGWEQAVRSRGHREQSHLSHLHGAAVHGNCLRRAGGDVGLRQLPGPLVPGLLQQRPRVWVPDLLDVHHFAQLSDSSEPDRDHGDRQGGPRFVHRLGPRAVQELRQEGEQVAPGRSAHVGSQRGFGADRLHLQRQDGHSDGEPHGAHEGDRGF
mmetsp:Transcript_20104/g.41272  ORF Transcript_20104/g.41272 Transcript_20104/m.41272 type:complete len:348 (+) Transcript_20104:398-1441(+)